MNAIISIVAFSGTQVCAKGHRPLLFKHVHDSIKIQARLHCPLYSTFVAPAVAVPDCTNYHEVDWKQWFSWAFSPGFRYRFIPVSVVFHSGCGVGILAHVPHHTPPESWDRAIQAGLCHDDPTAMACFEGISRSWRNFWHLFDNFTTGVVRIFWQCATDLPHSHFSGIERLFQCAGIGASPWRCYNCSLRPHSKAFPDTKYSTCKYTR